MAYTPSFNPQPLGKVTVSSPGTPVRLTSVIDSSATDLIYANKINVNAIPGNVGSVYIGTSSMVRSTLSGVIWVISQGQGAQITHNVGCSIYEASAWYVDADNAGDGVYGSIDIV